MANTFANLKLNRIIVHEVLLASDLESDRQPSYSEELLDLGPRGEQLLCKRLIDSMGSDSHSVELAVEMEGEGSTFHQMTSLFESDKRAFIDLSQDLAARLTNAQTAGSIKAGIALVVDGTMGTNSTRERFVALIKAESDSAFVKERTGNGVRLRFNPEMVLGAQQRLFKIGCFIENKRGAQSDGGVRSADEFQIIVYDHQMSNSGENNAARYFYGTFLGCRLADNAARLTRIFYKEASKFINEQKLSPQKRLELRSHLVSYLKSQERHISVRDFADRYLQRELREAFNSSFKKANFPSRDVHKDITHIKRNLQVRRMVFDTKVKISAPEEEFDDLVKMKDEIDGWTHVMIKGSLETQK